ncbi:hypothetical protein BSBH6_00659 [Bacillus subtilis]|nr:hypothetical protein BSBH6_00659 [Bacillus subtilis]RPK27022.1 hypothetical protein BH5_00657 [Bacillus subtilis]
MFSSAVIHPSLLRDATKLNDVSLDVSSKSFTGKTGLLINKKPQTAFAA